PCQGEGTGFLLFPPFTRGKGGSNVMKITEYHFSNILLGFTSRLRWETLLQRWFTATLREENPYFPHYSIFVLKNQLIQIKTKIKIALHFFIIKTKQWREIYGDSLKF
ncbi:MAG: hypothetical protein AN485_15760, partial [Anabaena sp. MDT14b]